MAFSPSLNSNRSARQGAQKKSLCADVGEKCFLVFKPSITRLNHELLQQQKHKLFLSVAVFAARHLQPVIKLSRLSLSFTKKSSVVVSKRTYFFLNFIEKEANIAVDCACIYEIRLSISSRRSVVCNIEPSSNYWLFTINHSNRILITWVTNVQQQETQPQLRQEIAPRKSPPVNTNAFAKLERCLSVT